MNNRRFAYSLDDLFVAFRHPIALGFYQSENYLSKTGFKDFLAALEMTTFWTVWKNVNGRYSLSGFLGKAFPPERTGRRNLFVTALARSLAVFWYCGFDVLRFIAWGFFAMLRMTGLKTCYPNSFVF